MPTHVKVLTANYEDIIPQVGLPIGFSSAAPTDTRKKIDDLIAKDLPRNRFIDSNGKTFTHLRKTWLPRTESSAVSLAYNQGNIDGSFFSLLLLNYYLKILNSEIPNPKPEIYSLDSRQPNFVLSNRPEVSAAYFDDDGIPCALNINYSPIDPDLWSVSIIRNPHLEPAQREVMIVTAPELIPEDSPSRDVEVNEAFAAILSFTGSEKIKDLLTGLILSNGKADISALDNLNSQIQPMGSYDEPVVKPGVKPVDEPAAPTQTNLTIPLTAILAVLFIAAIAATIYFSGGLALLTLLPSFSTLTGAAITSSVIAGLTVVGIGLIAGSVKLANVIAQKISDFFNKPDASEPPPVGESAQIKTNHSMESLSKLSELTSSHSETVTPTEPTPSPAQTSTATTSSVLTDTPQFSESSDDITPKHKPQ